MTRCHLPVVMATLAILMLTGCQTGLNQPGADDADADLAADTQLVADVAAKAIDVGAGIGGADGFGGTLMAGYAEHGPAQMGFHTPGDLAVADGEMMIRLHNEADEDSTFHLTYIVSHMGLEALSKDVEVRAGEEITVGLPCAEIVGLGNLDLPGTPGSTMANDDQVDNTMAVPGFLGLDHECGGLCEYWLTPDVDDLDGDGDTEELILLSRATRMHLENGGPGGHLHGDGPGMMGSHMGM